MHFDTRRALAGGLMALVLASCDDATGPIMPVVDPGTAPRAVIDRFSDQAATLFKRSENPSLPAAGAPIDLDVAPFVTAGLGPAGQPVRYYNFDVMPTTPAPIWVFYREGSDTPVEGQLNVVDQIPGEAGYSDFWVVNKVTVPPDYVANTVTSLQGILDAGYPVESTDVLVNCPLVPEGSVGRDGAASNGLTQGWYKNQIVFYFNFDEAPITASGGMVPVSEIYVAFNLNPDQEEGGPASGFRTEAGSDQTHNVVETLPGDEEYSPLWVVLPYDNAVFDDVHDIESAEEAPGFAAAGLVNCPVTFVGAVPVDPGTAELAVIDRFSDAAGHLFRRSANGSLPGPGEAIDFDQQFLGQGLGPQGQVVRYYDFDQMSTAPALIFAFERANGTTVPGQLNVVDAIPGDPGYNDIALGVLVTVPDNYVANTVTSAQEILDAGYDTQALGILLNRPIVPAGSTAALRLAGDPGLVKAWYAGKLIFYFIFAEAQLHSPAGGIMVPTSNAYVAFNANPGEYGGGPASGSKTEPGSIQTHNVSQTLPGGTGYSPLWYVRAYDNASFDAVHDLASAVAAPNLGFVATVNAPIVVVQ